MLFTYDWQDQVRDLSSPFIALVQKRGTFLSRIQVGPAPTNTKHEWNNDVMSGTSSAIASFSTDGDGTGIVVGSTSGFLAGDIIHITSATGQYKSEVVRITSITNSTTMVIERDYAATTGVTLIAGDVFTLMSRPRPEGSAGVARAHARPTTDWNQTEIIDETVEVTKSTKNLQVYGVADTMGQQVDKAVDALYRRLAQTAFYGQRIIRDSDDNGNAGGLIRRIIEEGSLSINVGTALADSHLNALQQAIVEAGGGSNGLLIVVPPNQAARISAFNTYVVPQGSRETGGAVTKFRFKVPYAGCEEADILVDPYMAKDQILMTDETRNEINWYEALTDSDTSDKNVHSARRRIIGEYTHTWKNIGQSHGVLRAATV